MSKSVNKKTGVKRPVHAIATAISTTSETTKKKPKKVENKPNKAAEPSVSLWQDLLSKDSSLNEDKIREDLLNRAASTIARQQYETFISNLNFTQKRGQFDEVTFGDVLHVVPAININKKKFYDLYRVDEKVAQIYRDAQVSYESLKDKAETLKLTDYAKHKKLLKKKESTKNETTSSNTAQTSIETETTVTNEVAQTLTSLSETSAAESTVVQIGSANTETISNDTSAAVNDQQDTAEQQTAQQQLQEQMETQP